MERILYLSRGGSVGGSQRQLYHVLTNLDRDLYEPIVAFRNDGPSCDQFRQAGFSTHILPMRSWRSFPRALFRYWDAWRLADFARRKQVSLIHSSDLWLSGYLNFAASRIQVPSVLHVRTPLTPECVNKHRCDESDHLIAISRRVRNNLLDGGIPGDKITVINDSVDIDAFHPSQSRRQMLKRQYQHARGLFVGIVGRIDNFKRQLDFLRAARSLVRDHKQKATFFIIGAVHSESYYQQLLSFIRDNDLQRHVILTGPRDDMPQVLGSLDILISLSGGSIMFEAMASAKPVISAGFSTKANSVHIQDRRTGILIESKSNSELVKAALSLMNSSDLRRDIGNRARTWAEDSFSSINMTIRTQLLYEKVLTGYKERTQPVAAPVPQPGAVG